MLAVIGGVVAIQTHDSTSARIVELVESGGYIGVGGASILSGFNLAFPIPIIHFFPSFVAAGLNPLATVTLIATGMTVGDAIGVGIGVMTRRTVRPPDTRLSRWIGRMYSENPRRVWAALVGYAALVPLPNELFVLPLSYLGLPPLRIIGSVLFGNLVFNAVNAAAMLWLVERMGTG